MKGEDPLSDMLTDEDMNQLMVIISISNSEEKPGFFTSALQALCWAHAGRQRGFAASPCSGRHVPSPPMHRHRSTLLATGPLAACMINYVYNDHTAHTELGALRKACVWRSCPYRLPTGGSSTRDSITSHCSSAWMMNIFRP
jgi:hypothetical protein